MASSEASKQWLEVDVCLMKKQDQEDKTAGKLDAKDVNILRLSIKIDAGCRELALPKALVEQLHLVYSDTVNVSYSTDNNVPIDRFGPVIIVRVTTSRYFRIVVRLFFSPSFPSLDVISSFQ